MITNLIVVSGMVSRRQKEKQKQMQPCFHIMFLIVVSISSVSAVLMTLTLFWQHALLLPEREVMPGGLKDKKEATKHSAGRVAVYGHATDALGRPLLVFPGNEGPVAAINEGVATRPERTAQQQKADGTAPLSAPLSTYIYHNQQQQQLQKRAEAECLALLAADSQSSPAEPSTLIACRGVFLEKTLRESGRFRNAVDTDHYDNSKDTPLHSNDQSGDLHRRNFDTTLLATPPTSNLTSPSTRGTPVVASLRNEAERCNRIPNDEAPPVLLWRAKRTGGSTLAALFVRFAFIHKLEVIATPGAPPKLAAFLVLPKAPTFLLAAVATTYITTSLLAFLGCGSVRPRGPSGMQTERLADFRCEPACDSERIGESLAFRMPATPREQELRARSPVRRPELSGGYRGS
jgi:hypothetical protein